MDGWIGQTGGHGHEGQVGQVRRVGTGEHERAARGRCYTNARSTKIQRSAMGQVLLSHVGGGPIPYVKSHTSSNPQWALNNDVDKHIVQLLWRKILAIALISYTKLFVDARIAWCFIT